MSEEQFTEPEDALLFDQSESAEEYEEISCEEVDRIVGILEELMSTVQSENVRAHLEDASNSIFYLVYDEQDEEQLDAEAA